MAGQMLDSQASMQMSRRKLLAAAATGIVAAAVLPAQLARAASKPSGLLRAAIGEGDSSNSMDPTVPGDHFAAALDLSYGNPLVEIGPNGSLAPELAESWETTDAMTWVFRIRQGVEFHNGKTLTSEDVVASLNLHRDPNSKSVWRSAFEQISDIRADGSNVVITLNQRNADLPFLLSDWHLIVLPSSDGKIENPAVGIGTGGYVVQKFEPGVIASLKRNANYWKEGRANFEQVEIMPIVDGIARLNALMSGSIDVMGRADPKAVSQLANVGNVSVKEVDGSFSYTFPMRTDIPPFNDNNLRLAVKHAIDREALLKLIVRGHGKIGNDQPINANYHFFDSSIPQRTYDPEKARFYLKQAGLTNFSVNLSAADAAYPRAADAAVLYKESAAKARIDINVVREPNDGYWDNVWRQKPWVTSYTNGRPTADILFSLIYKAGGSWNDSYWEHERFNKLLVEARGELDEGKRAQMYSEMQTIVRDEGGNVIPLFANNLFVTSSKVATPENMAGDIDLDGARFADRWWFT